MPTSAVRLSKRKRRSSTAGGHDSDRAEKSPANAGVESNVPHSKLLSLPVEVFEFIHDELLSGSHLITRETVLRHSEPYLSSADFEYRADILRPLTQTCRVLRNIYLPKYYEHVEACIVRSNRAWYKQLSERLEATSNGLTARADLAKLVRVVTVTLTRCSTDTVLPAFATCLSHLPNLHTLWVMHAHSQMTTALKNAFEGKHYPQIRTIILPSCAHNVLRACPGVVEVICSDHDGSKLLTAIAKECRNVEVLEGFSFWKDAMAKRLTKSAPRLKRLHLHAMDAHQPFGKIPNLSEVVLIVSVISSKPTDVEKDLANSIDATSKRDVACARTLLSKSNVKAGKALTVHYRVRDFANAKNSWGTPPWMLGRVMKMDVTE